MITWWIRNQKEARQLSYYLLTHCAVAPRMAALVEFGPLRRYSRADLKKAIRQGHVDVVERRGVERCAKCGSCLIEPRGWGPQGSVKGTKPPPHPFLDVIADHPEWAGW